MKQSSKILSIFVITILVFVSCNSAPSKRVVAVLAPLTGSFSQSGIYIQNGIEIAKAELKKRNIELNVSYEDACLPVEVLKALKYLNRNKKLKTVLANYCLIGLGASKDYLTKNNIITFQNDTFPSELVDNKSHIFSLFPPTKDEAAELAQYSIRQLKAKKIASIYVSGQWGESFSKHFSDSINNLGGEIVESINVPISALNFKAEIFKIKKANPDLIFIAHVGAQLVEIIKEIRKIGIKVPLISTGSINDKSVIEAIGDLGKGLVFFVPHFKAFEERLVVFKEGYKAKYGSYPVPLTQHAYLITILYAEGLQACADDSSCIAKRFEEEVLRVNKIKQDSRFVLSSL